MTIWKSLNGAVAIAAVLGGTSAYADVTASDVWTDWHDYMTGFGYRVTFDRSQSGDTLTIDDLTFAIDLPEDSGTMVIDLGTISFQNLANGTVAILMPEEMPVGIDVSNVFSMILDYGQGDMSFIVSGTPDNMTYSYSASRLVIGIDNVMVAGTRVDDAVLDLTMQNVSSQTISSLGNLRHITTTMGVEQLTYDFKLADPTGGNFMMSANGSLDGLSGTTESFIPKDINFEKMPEALNAGFGANANLSFGAGDYEASFTEGNDSFTGKSSSTSGSIGFSLDRKALGYGIAARGIVSSFSGSEIPLPSIDYEIGELIFDLLMPLEKTNTPSDFSMKIKLGDFSISESIWSLIDGAGILPHDPSTILVDITGKANWLIDIMDPASAEMMGAQMPGQIHAMNLNGLQVKMAGAELTGSGDFTFDNNDLDTFDGLPKPTGAVDLKVVGANGLMDNLVKMGLLQADDVMGARMMMGLFAVVSESEDDTLTSRLEVNEDGHVLANGQRLK